MKRSLPFILAVLAAVGLSSYIYYETAVVNTLQIGEATPKEQVLMKVIMQSLKNGHFDPVEVNDEFSEHVFDLYLKRTDYGKRFLLAQDVAGLAEYKTHLDEQVTEGRFEFFDLSYEIIQARTKEAQEYYQEILAHPFDFSVNEEIELDDEKKNFAKTREDLKEQWRKQLKYQVLIRISEYQDEQEKALENSDTVKVKSFEEFEEKARKAVLKSHDRWFERLSELDREDRLEIYINAVTGVFGPHTGYFPPKVKENFDISMSGRLEGIGAQLQEKDGYIKVTRIVPGSASYRQGELEVGDIIMKVAQGDEEAVDVVDMPLDDAVELIRGKKGTTVKLTVKKVNGLIKVIPIVRDVVVLEETYARSAVITNGTGTRAGYIKLPKFYADFNKLGGKSAAEDIATELKKLQEEGIEGIVIDLRGNGGGSLKDAIDMTGHFIEKGPVVQVKSRFGAPEIMGDYNDRVLYNGPLVVMMDHFSASASEIVAAALQDYHRAVIIGTTSFGKGTVQRFYELDRMLTAGMSDIKPLGAIKVTTQKFYRINGDATQLKGVTPDILVPDQYNYIEMGEKDHEYVMEWDEIEPSKYVPWTPTYDLDEIKGMSEKRIRSNHTMQLIDENAKRLKEQRDQTVMSLNYDEFIKQKEALDKAAEKYDEILKDVEALKIENLLVDANELAADTVKMDLNEKWLKKLKQDIFIDEAVNVINDMKKAS